MFTILSNFDNFFDNPVDQVFFLSIAFVVVLLIVLLIASKIISARKANSYLKEIEAIKKDASQNSIAKEEIIEPVKEEESSENNVTEEAQAEDTAEAFEEETQEVTVDESEAKEEIVEETQKLESVETEEVVTEENSEELASSEETVIAADEKEDTAEESNVVETEEEQKKTNDEPKLEEPVNDEVSESLVDEETEAIIEPMKEKKGRSYNGKYEVYQAGDGYAYCLKASNGEQLVVSETFKSRDGVLKAIDAVKRNLETGEVKIFADKRGKYKFKLISKNYRVLAISSNYSTEKSAERAVESFKKFALKADIVDIEVEDVDAKTATIIEVSHDEFKLGGKFCIEKFNGEFSWDLKAANGQILCQAEGYTSKAGCLYSIETFKKNVEVGTFKCVKDKTNRYCYKLYSTVGRIIAVGESYTSKQGAISAANSVCAYYKYAEIVEIK